MSASEPMNNVASSSIPPALPPKPVRFTRPPRPPIDPPPAPPSLLAPQAPLSGGETPSLTSLGNQQNSQPEILVPSSSFETLQPSPSRPLGYKREPTPPDIFEWRPTQSPLDPKFLIPPPAPLLPASVDSTLIDPTDSSQPFMSQHSLYTPGAGVSPAADATRVGHNPIPMPPTTTHVHPTDTTPYSTAHSTLSPDAAYYTSGGFQPAPGSTVYQNLPPTRGGLSPGQEESISQSLFLEAERHREKAAQAQKVRYDAAQVAKQKDQKFSHRLSAAGTTISKWFSEKKHHGKAKKLEKEEMHRHLKAAQASRKHQRMQDAGHVDAPLLYGPNGYESYPPR